MSTITYKRNGAINNIAHGKFTSDGSAQAVSLGFNPVYMKVFNETDVIMWEKTDGDTAADCFKTTGVPAVTVDTGSAILFNGDGTVTLSSTLVGTSKAISFIAIGA